MSTDEASTEEEIVTETSGSSSKLIKIGGLLAVVLGLQVVVVWWLLSRPSVPATPQTDGELIESQFSDDNFDSGGSSVTDEEVPIDSFNCTNTSAIDEGVIHVSFHLAATTSPSNRAGFELAVTQSAERRVKEAVERVARNAPYDDLKDPYLASIKRQIKDEINKVLRKSYVNDILLTEFKIIEQ
ncbi:hypothetical protein Pla110_08300 [Polystyrenella longa]|uniref:Flagellar protein FliL n=1 Tax=Polystyrenella longa TaxID=2528007 RepID=A0A518CIR2_9PLAN|nr:flagellar basal body-associated FliL family protein [Polystyrenella longa]QDU79125.1 hypothetical protein Pla110_08300 [Polystyrenella longa]